MNMTVVLVSKRSIELLATWSSCLLLLATLFATLNSSALSDQVESTARLVVADESKLMSDDQFSQIVQQFGEQLSEQMNNEMDELISLTEKKVKQNINNNNNNNNNNKSDKDLEKLRDAKEATTKDIKTRIELVGDNSGALPQMSLGGAASSFLAQASSRLQSAGSYIGNKIRTLSGYVAPKIPARLRRHFRWPSFLKFKLRFNKTYGSLREEIFRQMLFLKTHISVGVQHVRFFLGRDKHVTGATQFADWTQDEFHDKMSNKQAEKSASDVDPTALAQMDNSFKAHLLKLSSEGKNIFGLSTSEFAAGHHHHHHHHHSHHKQQQRRRRKRDATEDDYEDFDDELADDEEEEEEVEAGFVGSYESLNSVSVSDSDSDDDDLDPEKLFEEFANAQLESLDDISSTLDELVPSEQQQPSTTAKPSAASGQYTPLGDDNDDEIAEQVSDTFQPIDLRKTGCIIRPENQEDCGCCYAFALNAAASYYNCMEKYHEDEKLVRYHPFYTAECGRHMFKPGEHPLVNGCSGGRISKAFAFIQMVGVQRYTDYNCVRQSVGSQVPDGTCVYPRPDKLDMSFSDLSHEVPTYKRSRFSNMKLNEIDLHLRTVGPVFVNIRTWRDFDKMQAGVYGGIEEAEKPGIHSMLIVGHDKDCFNRDYWIIWNSYGINWGERGFVRLYTRSLKHFTLFVGGLQAADYSNL